MNSLLTYFKSFFSSELTAIKLDGLEGVEKADAILQNLSTHKKIPGLSVSIIKQGKTILQKGYGFADIENKIAVNPNSSIFRIASISKCITGLAFGKMVEEGILDWDDSFYKHVPYYPKKQHDFTLRQLASHTAGIRAYKGKEYGLNKPYAIKDSLEVFKNDPLVFEPGKGYLYNSFDFVLLSLAMQEACSIPFKDYVKEKVLIPLDLMNTLSPKEVFSSIGVTQEISEYYTKTPIGFKKAIPVNNSYKLAGGGYLSTSSDIAKLGQAILTQKLLKTKTYKELLTTQKVKNASTYYGLGFQVSQDAKKRHFIGHVGSSVGAYSNLFVYPNEEIVIAVMVNCTDPKVQEDLDKAINSIHYNTENAS